MMVHQCLALFVLKWTLLVRGRSHGGFWAWALVGLLMFLGALLAIALAVAFHGWARYAARHDSPFALLLLLDAALLIYCFFFCWGVLMELQRTDLIDFRKMLHLPVSLPAVYAMNYAVSLVSPLPMLALPVLIAMLLGLSVVHGPVVLIVGCLLAALFMATLGAWAYYLRGRLAILMENKRKRRWVFMLLPMGFIALGQLPAFLSHLAAMGIKNNPSEIMQNTLFQHLLTINSLLPVTWPAFSMWTYLNGEGLRPTLLCVTGLLLFTALGLLLGYRSTLRYYLGEYDTGTRAPSKSLSRKMPVTARTVPGFRDDTVALTLAFYRSYARHPHVRMLMIMPLCLGLFFLFMYRTGAYGGDIRGEETWIPAAGLLWPFFNFSFFMFNIFGIDAAAFPGLMLMPTPRYKYLFAKNLALAPFVFALTLFFVVMALLLVSAQQRTLLLSLALIVHLFFLFCIVGNLLSLRFPYRLSRDAMRMPTNRLRMLVMGLLSSLLATAMVLPSTICMLLDRMQPALLPEGGLRENAGLGVGVTLAFISVVAYRMSLPYAGDMLTEREQTIHMQLSRDRE